jgi:hypothetical protein
MPQTKKLAPAEVARRRRQSNRDKNKQPAPRRPRPKGKGNGNRKVEQYLRKKTAEKKSIYSHPGYDPTLIGTQFQSKYTMFATIVHEGGHDSNGSGEDLFVFQPGMKSYYWTYRTDANHDPYCSGGTFHVPHANEDRCSDLAQWSNFATVAADYRVVSAHIKVINQTPAVSKAGVVAAVYVPVMRYYNPSGSVTFPDFPANYSALLMMPGARQYDLSTLGEFTVSMRRAGIEAKLNRNVTANPLDATGDGTVVDDPARLPFGMFIIATQGAVAGTVETNLRCEFVQHVIYTARPQYTASIQRKLVGPMGVIPEGEAKQEFLDFTWNTGNRGGNNSTGGSGGINPLALGEVFSHP